MIDLLFLTATLAQADLDLQPLIFTAVGADILLPSPLSAFPELSQPPHQSCRKAEGVLLGLFAHPLDKYMATCK